MDMSQQQKKSVSLPQSLRKRKMMADVTNMSQRTCRLEIKVPTQTVYVVGTEIKVMVDRQPPAFAQPIGFGTVTSQVHKRVKRNCLSKKDASLQTMMPQRSLTIDTDKTTRTTYVLGTQLTVNVNRCAPPLAKSFSVKCTPNVYYKVTPQASGRSAVPYPLTTNSILIVTMDTVSETANDSKLSVRYYGEKTESLGDAVLHLTAVEISLDVDADRDGVIEKNNPNKGSWKWGPKGHGAILLVNCDSETKYSKKVDSEVEEISKVSDLQDMSKMILRTNGPAELPEGYKLTMHISQTASENVRVFRPRTKAKMDNTLKYQLLNLFLKDYMIVVGRGKLTQEVPYLGGKSELELFAEGLRFPDKDFDGLITINLSLTEPSAKDEIEFGYIDSPHHRFPVVLDSPRDGDLQEFPYNSILNCIDWNRDVLKKELGLEEEDIIDLPILFKMIEEKSGTRAVAYYPDMVNMIVLGDQLGIPKPFGPQVNGKCALETEVSSLLEPLGLKCNFIDDFAPYHKLLGEIHCGSNVRREPSPFKWWNVEL
ncbi:Protein-arginine deiminase type-2 [Labeo rohita]|uniref:Protein-arginine deiminase type-2 n=1 Tax=Labeo rohita TaxID=84645 RepID=A0ABQ8MMA5_LABRO|nr:Protein-arginine deiminase type-2 [Labeo rohita]